jgi:hypothetical protein
VPGEVRTVRPHDKHDAILELGRAGETVAAITRRLRVDPKTVRRLFDLHGVPHGYPRRRWRADHPSPRVRVRRPVA